MQQYIYLGLILLTADVGPVRFSRFTVLIIKNFLTTGENQSDARAGKISKSIRKLIFTVGERERESWKNKIDANYNPTDRNLIIVCINFFFQLEILQQTLSSRVRMTKRNSEITIFLYLYLIKICFSRRVVIFFTFPFYFSFLLIT